MTVLCTGFKRFMGVGDSRSFLATSDTKQDWIIKAHGNPEGEKSLFNELVAGRLAALIGLPWPHVSVAKLSDVVMAALKAEGFQPASRSGVGLQYIEGLHQVPWPEGGYRDPAFAQRNAGHILNLIPDAHCRDALYGKMIFDNWVLLRDTKYDTLYLDTRGKPFFLDASYAFGGNEWDESALAWMPTAIDIQSPYLEGVLDELSRFQPWLARLQAITETDVQACTSGLPIEWSVPDSYASKTVRLLKRTTQDYVPLVQQWLKWKELSCSI